MLRLYEFKSCSDSEWRLPQLYIHKVRLSECSPQVSARLKSQPTGLTTLQPPQSELLHLKHIWVNRSLPVKMKSTVTLVMRAPSLQASDTASSDSPPPAMAPRSHTQVPPLTPFSCSVLPSSAARKIVCHSWKKNVLSSYEDVSRSL